MSNTTTRSAVPGARTALRRADSAIDRALDAIDKHYAEHRLRKQQASVAQSATPQSDPFAVTPQRTISLAERKHNARELVISLYPDSCEERSSHLCAIDLCNEHEHLDAIVAYLHNHKPHDARQSA